jgi:hypothetical protein
MFIIKNSGQYEHITNLQPRSKYVTHRNNKSQKNVPFHITQSPKISNQKFRDEIVFPSESFEPIKHNKHSYSVDQINFLNNKLIQSTHKAKLKRLTSAAPLSIKSFPQQSTPLNDENAVPYKHIQPKPQSTTHRPHSAMNIISKSHSLELLSKQKQKPLQRSTLYKLVPPSCSCSTTTDRYKPTSFNLFLQKINDSNLYKQSIKQLNITKYLKHKELSSRNLYNNNDNSCCSGVHDMITPQQQQQRYNMSNVFNTIDHSAMPSASSKELLDRFSRVFQSNSSLPLDPVQKYATLINHESNKCYIYNTLKRNESAFTKEEIMKNTTKRNVIAKNQMIGNYINKTRSFSNKENKEYMKFYNRNPKCFRIQKSIGKDLDEMFKGYKGVCEWPFKKEVKVE